MEDSEEGNNPPGSSIKPRTLKEFIEQQQNSGSAIGRVYVYLVEKETKLNSSSVHFESVLSVMLLCNREGTCSTTLCQLENIKFIPDNK